MFDRTVRCPNCGSEHVFYRDVVVQVDYDWLVRDEDGSIRWTQDTLHTEYLDGADFSAALETMDGGIFCEYCKEDWLTIEAFAEEVREKEAADKAPPFGELAITHY
jgi:hypothetical protein